MQRKLLLLLLALLSTALPTLAYDFKVDGLCYDINENGTSVTVTRSADVSYNGDISIPATVTYDNKNYSVTAIGDYAFWLCTGLTSVTIPNSVTSIGQTAFSGCSGLTNVTIPNSVTSIGDYAFSGCSGLTSVTIPNSATSIGEGPFSSCSSLTNIKVETGNTVYDSRENCNSIIETQSNTLIAGCKNTTIPNSVSKIGYGAFNGCTGLASITIPNSVTSIGQSAFYGCSGLTSITIPNSVTSIDLCTFYNCSGLTNVNIPNSVTSIGQSAFYGCSGLTSITIPNSVTSIGLSAFSGCSGLTSITIPNSVTSIGSEAFRGCSGLTSVTIPNSVTSIGSSAFSACTGLTSLTLPDAITSIDLYTFYNCRSLTSVTIPNSVTSIGNSAFSFCSNLNTINIPNSLYKVGEGAFSGTAWYNNQPDGIVYIGSVALGYKGRRTPDMNFIFRDGTLGIAANAFNEYRLIDDYQLTGITIPSSMKYIGEMAFAYCGALSRITVYATTPPTLVSSAFYYVPTSANVTVPNGSLAAYQEADGWNNFINMAEEAPPTTYEDGCLYSGELKFRIMNDNKLALTYRNSSSPRYSSLPQAITIPDTLTYNGTDYIVTSLDANTFTGCNSVSSISIPHTVTSVGASAFAQCAGLVRVVFRDGSTPITLTNAGTNALFSGSPVTKLYIGRDIVYSNTSYPTFKYNTGIEELTIGSEVTTIPASLFSDCSNINKVTFSGSKLTTINAYAFQNCLKLGSISIPRSVTTIETGAFKGCSALSYAYLSSTKLTRISQSLFSGCVNLSDLYLPSSLTSIGEESFYNCGKLRNITLSNNITSIGSSAFYGCGQLSAITIPGSMTVINSSTFQDCTGLTSVTIPSTITDININAFKGCTGLREVTFEDSDNPLTLMITTSSNKYTNQSPFLNSPIQTLYIGRDLSYSHYSTSYYFPPFSGNTSLQSVTLGGTATRIPKYSFSNCTSLQKVTIPNTVTSIEQGTFNGCTNLSSISLPSSLDTVSDELFSGCTNLSSLDIPSTVSAIGSSAFYNCKNIENISIPSGVTTINESAFANCSGLKNVTIPATVTSINGWAFSACSSLNSINIPGSVVTIAGSAFSDCSSLESLVIPSSVTAIGINAFKNCSQLKYINFEDGNESLVLTMTVSGSSSTNQSPFAGCPLDSLHIGRDMTYSHYSSSYYFAPFADKTTLKKVTFGNNVRIIPRKSFNGCDALTNVTIPQNVTSIGDYAFYGKLLKEVHCAIINPITINSNVFYNPANSILVVPATSVTSYQNAEVWKTFGSIFAEGSNYVVPGTTIEKDGLTYVINDGGTTVSVIQGNYADLTEANIPPTFNYNGITLTVTSIKDGALSDCTSLTSLVIPNTVTSIGINAFKGCTALKNVMFEDGDESLVMTMTVSGSSSTNQSPFAGCPLESLYIGRDMTYSNYSSSYYFAPFADKTTLKKVTFGNDVTIIPKRTFQGCTSLMAITLPASVTSIGEYALNATSLREVHCAIETPISISSNVFNAPASSVLFVPEVSVTAYKNANVWKTFGGIHAEGTGVVLPGTTFKDNGIMYVVNNNGTTVNVTTGEYADIKSANIPSNVSYNGVTLSVTAINANAFYGAAALTSVIIPNTITTVGASAFANCKALTDVTVSDGTSVLEFNTSNSATTFAGCTSLTTIYLGRTLSYTNSSYSPFRGNIAINQVTTGENMVSVTPYLFYSCSGLSNLSLSNATTTIGQYAFYYCTSLNVLQLPAEITTIGTYAFYGNQNMTSVVSFSAAPPTIATSYTFDRRSSQDLYVNASAIEAYSSATYWKDFKIHPIEEFYAHLTVSYTKATVAVPNNVDQQVTLTKVTCNGKTYRPQSDGKIVVTDLVPGKEYSAIVSYQLNAKTISYTKVFTTTGFNPNITITNTSGAYTSCKITFKFPKNIEKVDGIVLKDIGIIIDGNKTAGEIDGTENNDYYYVSCVVNNLSPDKYYNYRIYYIVSGTEIETSNQWGFSTKSIEITNISVSTTQTTATVYYRVGKDAGLDIQKFYVYFNNDSIKATVTETTDTYYKLECKITGLQVNTNYTCYPGCYFKGTKRVSKNFKTNGVYGNYTKTISPTTAIVKATPYIGDAKLKKAYFQYNGQELNELNLTGLKPETRYSIPYVVETQSGNQTDYATFTTTALSLTTEAAHMLSNTKPLLRGTTNLADEETSCGFEWKRHDAPATMPAYVVYSPVTDGIICGTVQNMTENVYYTYRVFYKADDGTMYYGNEISFITADAGIYYSPIAYTYANALVQQSGVTIQGVAMPGSEEIIEQGFYYWITGANLAPGQMKVPATGAQKVLASGQRMSATLTGLRPGTNYSYCAFVKTESGITYGTDQSFKSEGLRGDINTDGIVNAGDVSALYGVILTGNITDMSIIDVNGDGSVNVGDITSIYNIILGNSQNAPMPIAECDDRLEAYDFELSEFDTSTLTLTLNNEQSYTAFQLDMLIPESIEIVDAWLDSFRAPYHNIERATTDDGRTRFIISATDNKEIDGDNGALLHITLRSNARLNNDAALVIDGIVMAKSDESTYILSPLTVPLSGTADISRLNGDEAIQPVNVYTLGGQLVKRNVLRREALQGLDAGYYLVGGKKVAVGR